MCKSLFFFSITNKFELDVHIDRYFFSHWTREEKVQRGFFFHHFKTHFLILFDSILLIVKCTDDYFVNNIANLHSSFLFSHRRCVEQQATSPFFFFYHSVGKRTKNEGKSMFFHEFVASTTRNWRVFLEELNAHPVNLLYLRGTLYSFQKMNFVDVRCRTLAI